MFRGFQLGNINNLLAVHFDGCTIHYSSPRLVNISKQNQSLIFPLDHSNKLPNINGSVLVKLIVGSLYIKLKKKTAAFSSRTNQVCISLSQQSFQFCNQPI